MRRTSALPLLVLLVIGTLLGCEDPEPSVEAPATIPERSDIVEATPATITTREPGEVLMLDVQALLQATAEEGGDIYGIRRDDANAPWRMLNGGAVDEAFVRQWLSLFTPLEADDRYPDLDADSVTSDVTHRIVFRFTDGSGRTLAMEQRGDGLAVVSQPDGPVFRLPADRLDDLVPAPSELRAD